MILQKQKFNIGEEVKQGTIVAIYSGLFYAGIVPSNANLEIWNKTDKNWIQKNVYAVKLKEPARHITFEEFQSIFPELDYLVLEQKYESIPLATHVVFIEEVLEKE